MGVSKYMDSATKKPEKFVGLHAHSMSIFDSIDPPKEHIDFARENGMDSLALTDHGLMNGFALQNNYCIELKKKGINFKPLFGNEAYYIPSLSKWKELKDERDNLKRLENIKPGDVFGSQALEVDDLREEAESSKDDEDEGGTVIENEEESKTLSKYNDPIKERSHLVLLAKNNQGLKSLFRLTSESASRGFYTYPRIDLDMLREHAKGNIIATSACVGSRLSKILNPFLPETNWKEWNVDEVIKMNFEEIQKALKKEIEGFQEVFGVENYYLELQLNLLTFQHVLNYHLIEASKRTGASLVVTCDSHYARPEHWREREIYKAIGWQQKGKTDLDIPKTIDELKCELYPKNAEQVWDSYIKYGKSQYSFYDDLIVKDAIERTYDIAHYQIDKDIAIDKSVKLPGIKKLVEPSRLEKMMEELGDCSEDAIAFKELKRLAILGMVKRKLDDKEAYIKQMKEELDVIKHLKFSKYFLTYYKIMEMVSKKQLTGQGRGCFLPNSIVWLEDYEEKEIKDIQVGDMVIDAYGNPQKVLNVHEYKVNENLLRLHLIAENYEGEFISRTIECTKDHKLLHTDNKWIEAQYCKNEFLKDFYGEEWHVAEIQEFSYEGSVFDLTVDGTHTYNISGISVHNSAAGSLLAYVLNITQVDPLKYGLLFARFLSKEKKCLKSTHFIKLPNNKIKQIKDIQINDLILTHTGEYKPVIWKEKEDHEDVVEIVTESGNKIICSPNHKWIINRNGKQVEVLAKNMCNDDELIEVL